MNWWCYLFLIVIDPVPVWKYVKSVDSQQFSLFVVRATAKIARAVVIGNLVLSDEEYSYRSSPKFFAILLLPWHRRRKPSTSSKVNSSSVAEDTSKFLMIFNLRICYFHLRSLNFL